VPDEVGAEFALSLKYCDLEDCSLEIGGGIRFGPAAVVLRPMWFSLM
jgi:hypothetical protein